MNNNEELFKNLGNALKNADETEFKAYLLSDESFDLDSNREDNNNMPKVVVWPKNIQVEGDQEAKFEEITAKVINFTQNAGQQINPRLYVVSDDNPDYVRWLTESPEYNNFIISIKSSDLVSKMKSANVNSEPVPAPVSEQEQSVENSQPPVAGDAEVKTEEQPVVSQAPVQPEISNNSTVSESVVGNVEVSQQPAMAMSESGSQVQVPAQGVAPMVQPENPVKENNGPVLVKTPNTTRRAGFVKYPVFILTLMAIGAFGIFIGKLLFTYLNQS